MKPYFFEQVWYTPYGKFVWIVTLLSFSAIAFTAWITAGSRDASLKTWKNLGFQIFFQISVFMRQPIRSFRWTDVTGGFLTLILLSVYETFITGSLIAPSPPVRFRHIGDLVNSGYKVAYDYARNPEFDEVEKLNDVSEEFKRYGIRHKINSTFVNISMEIAQYLVGKPEKMIATYYMGSKFANGEMARLQKLQVTKIPEQDVQRGQDIYCDFVTLGDVKPVSFRYSVPLMAEMHKVHRQLRGDFFILGQGVLGLAFLDE